MVLGLIPLLVGTASVILVDIISYMTDLYGWVAINLITRFSCLFAKPYIRAGFHVSFFIKFISEPWSWNLFKHIHFDKHKSGGNRVALKHIAFWLIDFNSIFVMNLYCRSQRKLPHVIVRPD